MDKNNIKCLDIVDIPMIHGHDAHCIIWIDEYGLPNAVTVDDGALCAVHFDPTEFKLGKWVGRHYKGVNAGFMFHVLNVLFSVRDFTMWDARQMQLWEFVQHHTHKLFKHWHSLKK